ncbi:MAG: hypothetical protein N2C14_09315 [Planctomycetales bacterium]
MSTDDQPENEAADETTDEKALESAAMSSEQSTENYIETYNAIAEWIRFADAKAGVTLTVGGALAGFLIPTLQDVIHAPADARHVIPNWAIVCEVLFTLYILFFLLSGVFAFLCINPFRERGKHPSLGFCEHFHPAAISAAYRIGDMEKFLDDCEALEPDKHRREVQAAILVDSHISTKKYGRVKMSIFHFGISVFFAFAYFIIAQL